MATQTTKTNTSFSRENQALALWKNKSKKTGKTYLSSNTHVAFYNTNKKNPKEPDLRVYAKDEEGKREEEVCSLWCNVSKKDETKKYLTGKFNGRDVIGFIGSDDPKKPYVSVYYREEKSNSEQPTKTSEKYEKQTLELDEEDLPF